MTGEEVVKMAEEAYTDSLVKVREAENMGIVERMRAQENSDRAFLNWKRAKMVFSKNKHAQKDPVGDDDYGL